METFRKNRTLTVVLLVFVLLFFMTVRGMSTRDWVITTLRGLAVGAVTFLAAAGMSLIFGLMDVLNLAHGTLFMIGAYTGWTVYVRPDTFVDILTPAALFVAALLFSPVWRHGIGRVRLSSRAARTWPWVMLVLSLVVLALTFSRTPIAKWDPGVYSESPIANVQAFESGQLATLIQPARYDGIAPAIGLGGVFVGGTLLAISLIGFAQRRQPVVTTQFRWSDLPWGAVITALALVVVGLGAYALNDTLTEWMFGLDTSWAFLIAVIIATLVGALLGGLMESTLIRPLYARPIYQLMLTLGLGFIGTEIVRAIWGRTGFTMPKPALFAGSGDGCPARSLGGWLEHHCSTLAVSFGEKTARIRVYNEIFLILVGLIVLIVVWILIQRTRLGMIIRAGVQDSEMVEALGINVRQVFTLVFALGAALAALGGVLSGPSTGLSDAMGGNLLLGALIALAVGGLTSFPGAAVGAVLVGLLQQFIIKYGQLGINLPFMDKPFKPTPPLVPASTVLLMVIILLVMPQGLLGRKE